MKSVLAILSLFLVNFSAFGKGGDSPIFHPLKNEVIVLIEGHEDTPGVIHTVAELEAEVREVLSEAKSEGLVNQFRSYITTHPNGASFCAAFPSQASRLQVSSELRSLANQGDSDVTLKIVRNVFMTCF